MPGKPEIPVIPVIPEIPVIPVIPVIPEKTNNIVFIFIFIFIFILCVFAAIYAYNSTNCIVSDWFACDGTKTKRKVTQATYGGTACTAKQNATITEKCCVDLDCSSNYSIIKDYYDKKGKWAGVFTMEPTNSNKVSETQCDVAYNYNFVPGGGRNDTGPDKRRFTLSADNTNCTWDVTAMGEYQSGTTV